MWKRIFHVFLACIVIIVIYLPVAKAGQALSIKKVVSVVFDDSGSMNDATLKRVYANYALQAFAGLLNGQDELSITYMNSYDQAQSFDVGKDSQDVVDFIRNQFRPQGITPIASVDAAISRLLSVKDSNPNTQYWLVIITDGQFEYIDAYGNSQGAVSAASLEKKAYDFSKVKMPNGSPPQVIYFAIGQDAVKINGDTSKGIYYYEASNSDKIVSEMSRIADKVSGRSRISEDKMTFLDSKTLQITTDLPMLNIVALVQKSSAQVSMVKSSKDTLTRESFVKLLYPKSEGEFLTDESLRGGIYLFDNGNLNTPAGTYTFTFNEPIGKDSVVIVYEPAIEMKMKVYLKDTKVEVLNIKDLFAEDSIDVECKIYESGTNKEIDPNLLSDDVSYKVTYYEGGNLKQEVTDHSLLIKNIKLNNIDSELRGTIEIPGYNPMTFSKRFYPMPAIDYSMVVDTPQGDVLNRTELVDNDKSFMFTIFGNGVPLTKEEVENLNIQFNMNTPYEKKLGLETTLNDNGTVTCVPIYKTWNLPWKFWISWPLFGIPTGDLELTGGIGDSTFKALATGSMKVEQESWLTYVINIVGPLFILFLLLGLLIKRRFRRGAKIYYNIATNQVTSFGVVNTSWPNKLSFSWWSFVPWLHNRITINGVTFHAMPYGQIGINLKKIGNESRIRRGVQARRNSPPELGPSLTEADIGTRLIRENAQVTNEMYPLSSGNLLFISDNLVNGGKLFYIGGN